MKINWGKALVLIFILFFIWIFSFVFFALRQNNDLVSVDYYEKGAKYTEQININQRSVNYQDSVKINTIAGQVQITFSKGLASKNDSVQVYFFRSSDKSKDVRLNFMKTDSTLVIDKIGLAHGRYQVFISWNRQGERYMVKKVLDFQ
jgi:hypothetical protein